MLINETDNPKFAEDDLVWVQVPSPGHIVASSVGSTGKRFAGPFS